MKRRLAATLATDVVGYSRWMEALAGMLGWPGSLRGYELAQCSPLSPRAD